MKEIKELDKVYIEEYDINVNRYLTYSQIQAIVNSVKKLDSWAEREQNIDMLVLAFATDIETETIENYPHEHWLKTGIIENVKAVICNIWQINDALKYEESSMRILTQIAKEMPEFSKKVDEVMKNASIGKK